MQLGRKKFAENLHKIAEIKNISVNVQFNSIPAESGKVWKKFWSFSSLEKSKKIVFGLLVWKKKNIFQT